MLCLSLYTRVQFNVCSVGKELWNSITHSISNCGCVDTVLFVGAYLGVFEFEKMNELGRYVVIRLKLCLSSRNRIGFELAPELRGWRGRRVQRCL
ncbi:hypothetical protein SRHO_G00003350 [Serrasalmus rhombeus]